MFTVRDAFTIPDFALPHPHATAGHPSLQLAPAGGSPILKSKAQAVVTAAGLLTFQP